MKFTKRSLEELQPKKYSYFKMDDGLDNFGVMIYPSGNKKFIIRLRFNEKIKSHVIKEIDKISLPQARKEASLLIDQYQSGIDVKLADKQEKLKDKTFNECVEDYLPSVKPTTEKDIKACMRQWGKWLDKPIREITSLMVLKYYDKRVKDSRHRTRLECAYLRSVWNYHKKELMLGDSPTLILNEDRKGWSKKTVKNRRLDFESASLWCDALNKLSLRDQNLFKLIYFTGLRAREATSLHWDNVNFETASLHLPDTKNGDPLDIPLNSQSIDILLSVKNGDFKHNKYIFPQVDRNGKVSSMQHYSKAVATIKKQGVMWSPHDSRRGFIVAGGILGLNNYIIKQLTNHIDNSDIHGNYQHYTVAEMRESSQKIGDYLNNQIHSSNVIEFKQKA